MTDEHDHAQSASNRPGPALAVGGVRKSFAGVTVLHGVDVTVRPATIHALVGHNGSGKSTLIKALAGFYAPDTPVTGSVFGRHFKLGDHLSASRAGLRFVHQDLGLVDSLSTVDNLALGPGYPLRRSGLIRWRAAGRRSREAMSSLGYEVEVDKPVGQLSASERTGVAIARALQTWSGDASVVVLDEPTASMPPPEVSRLFTALDRLRQQGLGIVYVTHHLDEILTLADDVTVLRNGRVVMSRVAAGLTHDDLVKAIVGRELSSIGPTRTGQEPTSVRTQVLEVDELTTANVHGISFMIAPGEIMGFAGITGSGRDEVLPAIAGAIPRGGSVVIGDKPVPPRRPRAATRCGLGFVPANRQRSAILPTLNSTANLTISGVQRYVRYGLLNHRAEIADAREWFTQLDVVPSNPTAPILTFSGGNQQKIMVGRWLRREPTLLALDEPTQGVDIGATQTIYGALRQAAVAGRGVLISSSDSDELASLCDRVVVMVRGKITAELSGAACTAEHIDAASLDTTTARGA